MTVKSITVYREMKVPAKQAYSSETWGGSITIDVGENEDYKQVYQKAWLIVSQQVLKELNESYATQHTKEELDKIDKALGF